MRRFLLRLIEFFKKRWEWTSDYRPYEESRAVKDLNERILSPAYSHDIINIHYEEYRRMNGIKDLHNQ